MFPESIMPAKGLICVAKQLEKGFKHFFLTPESALKWALALDNAGQTVFIGMLSYTNDSSRKGGNTAYGRSFFLDIDCGEGKPYATQKDGLLALGKFCKVASLPIPSIVNSGNGLYAVWTLDRDIPSALWHGAAKLLQAVVKHHEPGLDADGIVADRARVLRPVGSHNRKKGGCKPVTLLRESEPVNAAEFIKAVKAAYEATGEKLPAPVAQTATLNAVFTAGLDTHKPSSANIIADKCAQVGLMRDSKGDLPEPAWYGLIGLLRFTTESNAIIHEWSKGHAGYSHAATEAKINQHANAGAGPTTCVRLSQENPDLCKGCKYAATAKSPIVLGYAPPKPLPQTEENPYPEPPGSFRVTDEGVVYLGNDGDLPQTVYSYPLYVFRINRDNHGESFTIRHQLPHEGWREVTIASNKTVKQETFFSELINAHIHVVGKENRGLFMVYVETFMEKLRKETKMAQLSGQMGWNEVEGRDLSFVQGAEVYAADGSVQKVGYSASTPEFVKSMAPQGDSKQWSELTKIFNREGLEGLAFEFLCGAFGAPLVRFTGFEGAMVTVVGDSGMGKTLTGRYALSAWGDSRKLMLTHRDTANSLAGRLGVYGSLPAYIDEVSNVQADAMSDLAYMITQGREKARLNKNAVERANINQWNTLVLVSSNHSIMDKLANHKGAADAEFNRVFEFEIEEGFTKEEGAAIAGCIDGNWGEAGKTYARWLVQNQGKHKDALNKISGMLSEKAKTTPEERFWTMTGAVAIYGGMIAKSLGLSHINVERLIDWIVDAIQDMRKYKKQNGFDGANFLGSILDKYAQGVIVMPTYNPADKFNQAPYREPRGQIVARIEMDKNLLWISHAVLKQELQRLHISSRKLAAILRGRGLVDTQERVSLGRGTVWGGIAQYCWKLDLGNPGMGVKTAELVDRLAVPPTVVKKGAK